MAKKKNKAPNENRNVQQNDSTGGTYSEIQQTYRSWACSRTRELLSDRCTTRVIDGEIYHYCPCGGYLFEVKINDDHWYRCGDCGNDYDRNLMFTDTRTERYNR